MSIHGTSNIFDDNGNLVLAAPLTLGAIRDGSRRREQHEARTGLHVSGPFNSTKFTNCCGLAVMSAEAKCPGCGDEFKPQLDEKWNRSSP